MARFILGLSILMLALFNSAAMAQGQPFYDVTNANAFPGFTPAKCDGHTVDTAAFQAAITQAKSTGGTIVVPPTTGNACIIDSTLDFSNTGSVCLVGGIGSATLPGGGSPARPQLIFTQSMGPIIKFGASVGFCMKDLQLYFNQSNFTGVFIDGHTSATYGTGFATFQNIVLGGASTASCIISLDSTYNSIIDTVDFNNGQSLLCGPPQSGGFSYNNTVRNSFFEGGGTSVEILNPSNNWTIGPDNDFELFQSGGAPVAIRIQSGVSCDAISVFGNWAGDNLQNTNTFTLIDVPATNCSLTVRGNYLSGNPSSTTAISMIGGRLVADGNTFDFLAVPFSLSSGVVADIGANTYRDGVSPAAMSSMGGGGRYTDLSQTIFYGDGASGLPALQATGGLWVNGNASTTGNVTVNGTLYKSAGAFRIDHPLDPVHKYLLHSFVESPDMKNVYEGTVTLDSDGTAEIKLPAYFEALNRDFRYQLSSIGDFAPIFIAQEVKGNSFRIGGGKPGLKVSWLVTGVRQDAYANAHRIQVEELKPVAPRKHSTHSVSARRPACSQRNLSPLSGQDSASHTQSCLTSEK